MQQITIPVLAVENGNKLAFCAYTRTQANVKITLRGKSKTYWTAIKTNADDSLQNITGSTIGVNYENDDVLELVIESSMSYPLQARTTISSILDNGGKAVGHITNITVEDYTDRDFNDYLITIYATK